MLHVPFAQRFWEERSISCSQASWEWFRDISKIPFWRASFLGDKSILLREPSTSKSLVRFILCRFALRGRSGLCYVFVWFAEGAVIFEINLSSFSTDITLAENTFWNSYNTHQPKLPLRFKKLRKCLNKWAWLNFRLWILLSFNISLCAVSLWHASNNKDPHKLIKKILNGITMISREVKHCKAPPTGWPQYKSEASLLHCNRWNMSQTGKSKYIYIF